MKPAPVEFEGWTRRRWALTILVVLAAQLALIYLLSDWASPPAGPSGPPTRFCWLAEPTQPAPESELPWLDDPAQFALVTRQGFTGPIWFPAPGLKPPVREWTEAPRWLAPNVNSLGAGAARGVEPAAAVLLADRPRPATVRPLPEDHPVFTNSTLRIEGDLAGRALMTPLSLPRWEHPDVLRPSTVQVLVDAAGRVNSAVLLAGSELAAADLRALELARAARFEPLAERSGGSGLAWGRLVFHWWTVAPGSLPAPAPPPAP
ncbi:MAG: energy transducer TonB [Verrucomicrobia bacterium]|nr:energy transducer TonB [Verrucomicrobiota bacterium]